MASEAGYFADETMRPWVPEAIYGFQPEGWFLGQGPHPGGTAICGASREDPSVYPEMDLGQMGQTDRCTALKFDKQTVESGHTSFLPNRKMQ